MKYAITTKKFNLTDYETGHIVKRHIRKINLLFPRMTEDLAELEVILRKNKQRREIARFEVERVNGEFIRFSAPKLSEPFYYDGTIKLTLPRKVLVIHLYGLTVEETVNDGFSKLFREIKTYKGKHFKADSNYTSQKSLRKNHWFENF